MPHFDFDADYTPPPPPPEPITFRLAGQDFECIPPPAPWGPLTDVMRLAGLTDPVKVAASAHVVEAYILSVLRDDDGSEDSGSSAERFQRLRTDRAARVDMDRLGPVIRYLAKSYMGDQAKTLNGAATVPKAATIPVPVG